MNLIIYVNEEFEEERALYDLDSNTVILKGDYYHDKIDSVIEGYLIALEEYGHCNQDDVDEEWITKDHEKFKELEFYEGD